MPRTPKSILIAVILWIAIFSGIAVTVRLLVLPMFEEKRQNILVDQTGSPGRYQYEIKLALDSFSGYCLLRSDNFMQRLKGDTIKLTLIDDGADYSERIKALEQGDADMAVFPINSFLQTGAELGSFPATIVYVIDETQGADAIIAHKNSVTAIPDLNRKDARIIATPDSPSEFLGRVLLASFNLPHLSASPWHIAVDGSSAVYERFRGEADTQPYAYALWEPDVSKAKRDPNAIVLLDSSKLKGYIVDVLVVRREFLVDNYTLGKTFVEHYARTVYDLRDDMVATVIEDAQAMDTVLSKSDAASTVNGIAWKNTLENMAQFGLLNTHPDQENIEDVLHKISDVLVKTGALDEDPTTGKIHTLYFDQILKDMQAEKFHPARTLNVIQGVDRGNPVETLRLTHTLDKLSDAQWDSLLQVGELRVEPITFGRGTARITLQGKRELEALAATLKSWPSYYLMITGRVRSGGDEDAALHLAQSRADATLHLLIAYGIAPERMKTAAVIGASDRPEAQSVSFLVGQLPY